MNKQKQLAGPLSLVAMMITILMLAGEAGAAFYVVPSGPRAKSTIVVSPGATPEAGGQALLQAMAAIADNGESKPYLVHVEPGIYDLGSTPLQMKEHVDIQGSGEGVTTITGQVADLDSGVVLGSSHAELRFLTVENSGGGISSTAMYNGDCAPKLTHVTIKAFGGTTNNYGMRNDTANATLTSVTVEAGEGGTSCGLRSYDDSNVSIVDCTISGGTYGVYNSSSSVVWIRQSSISGTVNTIRNPSGWVFVSGSLISGGTVDGSGTTCAGVCDENYVFYPDSCP